MANNPNLMAKYAVMEQATGVSIGEMWAVNGVDWARSGEEKYQ